MKSHFFRLRPVAVGVMIILLIISYSLFSYRAFLQRPLIPNGPGMSYVFSIGSPLQTLMRTLIKKGYLHNPWYFKILAHYKGASRKCQAGEYYFPPGTTPDELLNMLIQGKVVQHKLTLIEGWTFADVLNEIEQNKFLKHTMPTESMKLVLQAAYKNPEGLFLPETYEFPYGQSDKNLLLWAHRLWLQRLNAAWDKRDSDLPYNTAYEAVIVASLIEKETADPDERYLIASVIVNRLRRNMPLQIDPSVIYGLYHKYIPVLSRYDLKIDTAYNTYLHKGLPPTPIALPSQASLLAALHPAKSDYLYFVLTYEGKHQFSTTYDQHLDAIAINRKIKRYKESFREAS